MTRLGLRANWLQFSLLVLVNAFVGAMVGVERSILPLLAEEKFHLASATAMLSFLMAFGLAKPLANLAAGELADRVGRRRLLIIGWLFGLPVPFILMHAPTWEWVVAANILLGINQGLAWSMTVIMKIDLVGPQSRGLAMGLNEFAGYLAVSLAALGASFLANVHGPAEAPFWIAAGAAMAGFSLSVLAVRDTGHHVALEHAMASQSLEGGPAEMPHGRAARLWYASWQNRGLMAANQAGFVNNLNDGLAWGILPLFWAGAGLTVTEIGGLAAMYPAVWAIAQIATGSMSDRIGRRPLIVAGMLLQALALVGVVVFDQLLAWSVAMVALGVGTALVYPTLIAQVGDLVSPRQRAAGVGIYRLWRDLGYVAGALLAGLLVDLVSFQAAIVTVALLTAGSGLLARVFLPGRSA